VADLNPVKFVQSIVSKFLIPDEMPKENTGEPKAELPLSMTIGMGEQGVAKTGKLSAFDYYVTAKDRYILRKRHPYVAAVHNAIVKQVKKVELNVEVMDNSKPYNEDTKERMEAFIRQGFGEEGEKEFRGRMTDTKKWYGDNFAEIVFDSLSKEPVLCNYLVAETMRVLPNEHGQIIGYPQVVDGALSYTFPPANIIHMREHPDEYSFFGFSDLDALFLALLLDIMADEYSTERLKNDASHGGIGVFDDGADQTELNRLRWMVITQLTQKPGKPIFLNRLKQWIPTGVNFKDIDWQELHRSVKEKVMMVYSVLPMQVAVVETGRLANPEQQLEIGEEYIKQELEQIQNFYNLKLTPFFKNSANLQFKFCEVTPKQDALQKDATIAKTKAETAQILSGIRGTFTKDELREVAGFEPLELGGDETYSNSPPTPFFSGGFPPNSTGEDEQDNEDESAVDIEGIEERKLRAKRQQTKPFTGYNDFADCVEQNSDKEDPNAYCAAIMHAVEGNSAQTETKALRMHKASRTENRAKFEKDTTTIYYRFVRESVKLAKEHYPKEAAQKQKSISSFETAMLALVNHLHRQLDSSTKSNSIKSYADAKVILGATFNRSDEKAIEAMLLTDGTLDAVKVFSINQREGFKSVIMEAFDKGLSERDMAKAMREYADTETYRLERIARTESNRFANRGRFAGYKELEERRGEDYDYEWVGPDDERTTEICEDIKRGNPYDLRGIMQATDGGEPHINCRHNVVRVVK